MLFILCLKKPSELTSGVLGFPAVFPTSAAQQMVFGLNSNHHSLNVIVNWGGGEGVHDQSLHWTLITLTPCSDATFRPPAKLCGRCPWRITWTGCSSIRAQSLHVLLNLNAGICDTSAGFSLSYDLYPITGSSKTVSVSAMRQMPLISFQMCSMTRGLKDW